jgi:fatty-acyl-CoA synthase
MDAFVLQEKTLGRLLDETVGKFPGRDAVVYDDRDYRLTWREFSHVVDRLGKGLMALGIERGEKIGIWATNVPHWVALMYATAKIGAILVTINTNYRETELEYLLKQSGTENLFIIDGFRDHDYIQTLYSVAPELRTQERGHLRCAKLPHLKRVMFLGMEKHRGMYSLPEVMGMHVMTSDTAYQARQAAISPHDVVNMQYTSGTTGFPKGVMLTHANILNNGYAIGKNQHFTEQDRVCLPVPLFHCFGCVLGVMACVNHGAAMIILENFSPLHVMVSVDQERCTALYGVPTMFISVLDHKIFSKFDYSSLRTGIMAGSVCPEPIMRRVMNAMNMREITIVYGLTESSPGMTQTRTSDSVDLRVQTVGRHMPGVAVAILDPETGAELPRGRHGEICCRGYNVMQGYYNMPEATAEAIDKNGWLHSGDLGSMDEAGYVRVTGRIKDMIIRGGENVYPREVEEYLLRLDGVADVQVVAVPSRIYGEEVGAFIIPRSGADLTPEDVRDFCRGKIAHHKIPRYVMFLDAFPMTASGKIQKFRLREMAAGAFPEAMEEKMKGL